MASHEDRRVRIVGGLAGTRRPDEESYVGPTRLPAAMANSTAFHERNVAVSVVYGEPLSVLVAAMAANVVEGTRMLRGS